MNVGLAIGGPLDGVEIQSPSVRHHVYKFVEWCPSDGEGVHLWLPVGMTTSEALHRLVDYYRNGNHGD